MPEQSDSQLDETREVRPSTAGGVSEPAAVVPPYDMGAEQSLLGSFIVDNATVDEVMDYLKADDFYFDEHVTICDCIFRLRAANKPVDVVVLSNEIKSHGDLDRIGGVAYLVKLTELVPTTQNVKYYAEIVKECSVKRSIIQAGRDIYELGFSPVVTAMELIDRTERLVYEASQGMVRGDFQPLERILPNTLQVLEERYDHRGSIRGIATGIKNLDLQLGGLQPQELVVLAARPSVGKTSLALNIAAYNAVRLHKPVGIFSLEMSREQLAERVISSEAMIEADKLRSGYLSQEDWQALTQVSNKLAEAPLFIDDTAGLTALEIRAKAKRLAVSARAQLLIVDYLQLASSGEKVESRVLEVAQITRMLKNLARELNVPIIVVSQLSRDIEKRDRKKPQLSDLRESGAIEQDADIVIFLYTDESVDTAEVNTRTPTNALVAKHRNGKQGNVKLMFDKRYTRFESLDMAAED
ncbi:MAG TPA: replicative DNA helicase [Candidatus Cryosericum sp.]|nr:replicative DNA helicase [Candidatus Cryosericum sp.]HOV50938.1 replicative DNA helicase [Candidatus Cryosericum sp.]